MVSSLETNNSNTSFEIARSFIPKSLPHRHANAAHRLDRFSQDCHIEFRVILLHIICSVFFAKLIDHRFDRLRWFDGNGSELAFHPACIDPNRWVLKNIPVPLRAGAVHRQQVKFFVFKDKPDGPRYDVPCLPANYSELDLAVFFEPFLQIALFRLRHCVNPTSELTTTTGNIPIPQDEE